MVLPASMASMTGRSPKICVFFIGRLVTHIDNANPLYIQYSLSMAMAIVVFSVMKFKVLATIYF